MLPESVNTLWLAECSCFTYIHKLNVVYFEVMSFTVLFDMEIDLIWLPLLELYTEQI